uniref:Uncharacterized protein n=1 Tax=Ascaris lumbricoides TaxID=6252 RepID=A0A0M3HPQ5_ASCLU
MLISRFTRATKGIKRERAPAVDGIQAERGSLIPVRHRRLYFIKYSSSAGVVYISGVILGKDDGYCWYGDE